MLKKAFKYLAVFTLVVLFSFVLILSWLRITEWQPELIETCQTTPEQVTLPDTITIVSWNIGYAGLGADMDFFYDGGTKTRTSKERTAENLNSIIDWLKGSQADVVMLQEVDFDSKRSYNIDQYETIITQLEDYTSVYAWNYVSKYVPLPISDPMGKVVSGLVTLSKFPISKAQRYAYPSSFAFPVRLFNLKRCMLSVDIVNLHGDTVTFNNTHNTAFDTGTMREEEFEFMSKHIDGSFKSFTAGDWNSTPPGYIASKAETENEFFSPIALNKDVFVDSVTFAVDSSANVRSARYNYEPYQVGITTTTLIDFGVATGGLKVISTQVIDLGFENSDHNPVVYKVTL